MSAGRDLVVVGGGVAGVAAAWCASRAGWRVTCVFDHGGASALASGSLQHSAASSGPHGAELHAFSEALGLWEIDPATRVVSSAGVVLHSGGRDRALLSLGPLSGKRVGVLDADRAGWDAPWLARSLSEVRWCVEEGIRFEARAVEGALHADELTFPDVDLAERLSVPERWVRFATALREHTQGVDAWLVGPWLFGSPRRDAATNAPLAVPIGETASAPGAAAGVRWEAARDGLLSACNVARSPSRASRVERRKLGWSVRTTGGAAMDADAVVVAVGGVAGGGLLLADEPGAPAFTLSLEVPFPVAFGDDRRHQVATAALDVQQQGARVLERVGVRTQDVDGPGLDVAGDVVFDQPRDLLTAAASGIAAAKRLAVAG